MSMCCHSIIHQTHYYLLKSLYNQSYSAYHHLTTTVVVVEVMVAVAGEVSVVGVGDDSGEVEIYLDWEVGVENVLIEHVEHAAVNGVGIAGEVEVVGGGVVEVVDHDV
eukprot:CAMPEP_0201575224 /NCGR_PEP_ID=MMETSP0190_2-20130828/20279_1 /ASSEMBLY_ACC=CAM_ASM_000263 /TAXON_ID=37353 /ORGANISM="Rosalina sp." /LENGTH=107 /DNA_ID=CAMNT_0048004571 /DNA_START=53 /DNA_END=376 /DNA_ORIENTATION=+